MDTIPILLLLVLSTRVLCNPMTYPNNDQPRLEGSLSNLPCGPLSGDYNWQTYINATEPQDSMLGNQTTFANASVVRSGATDTLLQGVSLLSTATLASSVAQPTRPAEARCEIIAQIAHSNYRPASIDLGPFFLQPGISALYLIKIASSYPVSRITIKGRLPYLPDIPESYYPIFADHSGMFSVQRALWVKISVAFGSWESKHFRFTLYQVILSDQNPVTV